MELAGGTGWWTERLARTADRLTVVDSSPEVLALNQARVGRSDVNYVVADLFDWQADSHYDVVFFSFWLSHVPRSRFGEFWSLLHSWLTPSGRAFLIDNRNDPQPETTAKDPFVIKYDTDLHLRRLRDGSVHRVVSVMYEPGELQSLIEAEGWSAEIRVDAVVHLRFSPSTLNRTAPCRQVRGGALGAPERHMDGSVIPSHRRHPSSTTRPPRQIRGHPL